MAYPNQLGLCSPECFEHQQKQVVLFNPTEVSHAGQFLGLKQIYTPFFPCPSYSLSAPSLERVSAVAHFVEEPTSHSFSVRQTLSHSHSSKFPHPPPKATYSSVPRAWLVCPELSAFSKYLLSYCCCCFPLFCFMMHFHRLWDFFPYTSHQFPRYYYNA